MVEGEPFRASCDEADSTPPFTTWEVVDLIRRKGTRPASNRLAVRLRQYPLDPPPLAASDAERSLQKAHTTLSLRSRDSQRAIFGGTDWRPGSAAQSTGSPLKAVQSGGGDSCRLDQEPGGSPFAKRWCQDMHSGLTAARIRGGDASWWWW